MAYVMKVLTALLAVVATAVAGAGTALAQEAGTTASVVLGNDLGISLDGNLDDWAEIPATTTVSGPQASSDPALNGRLRWQVAAEQSTMYFAATITDANIIAGQHGDNYWNEDSIEFYVNFSGDLAATAYGPGITQVRISAADIDTGGAASLSGIGLDQVGVTGVVFATTDGWGAEVAVDVSAIAQPGAGERFGLQVHANGASTLDRDLKVIWSARDTDDTSFQDPSVFGQGVFIEAASPAAAEADTGEDVPEAIGVPADDEDAAVPSVNEVESIVGESPAVDTGTDPQRSLLYSAIASAVFVFGGGAWFERKRRKDEERHLAAKTAAAAAAAKPASTEESIDEEFREMLNNLDDGAPTDG